MSHDNFTYVFIPRELVELLYASFSLPVPASVSNGTFNVTKAVTANDMTMLTVDPSEILYGGKIERMVRQDE